MDINKEIEEQTKIRVVDDPYAVTVILVTAPSGKKMVTNVRFSQDHGKQVEHHRNLSWLRKLHTLLGEVLKAVESEDFFELD